MNPQDTKEQPKGKLSITAEHAKQSLFQNLGEEEKIIIGRVIYAGMKMLFTKEMNDRVVEGIQRQDGMTPEDKLGIGVGHTLIMLYNESKGTMPIGALLPAGYVLLAKMCEFVNATGVARPVTDDDFGEALQMMNAVINRTFNPEFNGDLAEQGKMALQQGQQTEQAAQPTSQPVQSAQPSGLLAQGA
jgi:hypothetical protein